MALNLSTLNSTDNATYISGDMYDPMDVVDNCYKRINYHRDFTQLLPVSVTIITAYILIAILAILGNSLVIWTVWRNSHMHTVTNYYIVNLAISDLLVACLVMPLKLMEYTADCSWQVFTSNALCAVEYYLLPIFVFASVLTLSATSIERYYAIVHPLSAMKINSKSRTRKIIACTWVIPIVVASPYIFCESMAFTIYSDYGSISRQICNDRFDDIDRLIYGEDTDRVGEFRKGYFFFLFCVIYLIPSIVIFSTCVKIAISLLQPITVETTTFGRSDTSRRHEENKRKVARMVIVIAITFIACWSPQFLTTIVSQLQKRSFLRESNFIFTMLITHLFGFVNSCVNPIIYTAMSQKFRRSFKEIVRRIFFCCSKKYSRPYQSTRGSHRFTSTVRHTLSETDGNQIALHEHAYFGARGHNNHNNKNSKSSSSGAESDVRTFKGSASDRKIIKKYIFKANGCAQKKSSKEDVEKPLIPGSKTSPVKELHGILKNGDKHNAKTGEHNCIEDVKSDTTVFNDGNTVLTKNKEPCTQNNVRVERDNTSVRVRYLNS